MSEGQEDELRSYVDFLHVLWQYILANVSRMGPALLHAAELVARRAISWEVMSIGMITPEDTGGPGHFVQRFSRQTRAFIYTKMKLSIIWSEQIGAGPQRKVWLKSGGISDLYTER